MKYLVFCAGSHSPNLDYLRKLTSKILPKDLILIGVDGGANLLFQNGFYPDIAIGDFDSHEPPNLNHLNHLNKKHFKIIRLPCEKNDTDLEAALDYILNNPNQNNNLDLNLNNKNQIEIIILGAFGAGRLDHLIHNLFLAYQPRFIDFIEKMYFVEENNSVRFFRSGWHSIQQESDKKYLSFIGLTPIQNLSLRHVKYEISQKNYNYPISLISNEFILNHHWAYCSFSDGLICVIQSRDINKL